MSKYAIGIDYGTLSVRALLVNIETGEEVAASIYEYPHGVMEEHIPSGKKLPVGWALQDPQDYLEGLLVTVRDVVSRNKILPGEVVGIIGKNGAGKSTLLKIIAGVLQPTKGSVSANGKIVPMLELGSGFDMELNGVENIYLNGAILGYTKEFLDSKFEEIVEFSELEQFMDVPVKNFSSGMFSRLAFAVATIGQPDILIVDEVLSVGDFHFQQKCEARINRMKENGATILFVSHNMEQVRNLCSRIVWLEHGRVHSIGDADELCREYQEAE